MSLTRPPPPYSNVSPIQNPLVPPKAPPSISVLPNTRVGPRPPPPPPPPLPGGAWGPLFLARVVFRTAPIISRVLVWAPGKSGVQPHPRGVPPTLSVSCGPPGKTGGARPNLSPPCQTPGRGPPKGSLGWGIPPPPPRVSPVLWPRALAGWGTTVPSKGTARRKTGTTPGPRPPRFFGLCLAFVFSRRTTGPRPDSFSQAPHKGRKNFPGFHPHRNFPTVKKWKPMGLKPPGSAPNRFACAPQPTVWRPPPPTPDLASPSFVKCLFPPVVTWFGQRPANGAPPNLETSVPVQIPCLWGFVPRTDRLSPPGYLARPPEKRPNVCFFFPRITSFFFSPPGKFTIFLFPGAALICPTKKSFFFGQVVFSVGWKWKTVEIPSLQGSPVWARPPWGGTEFPATRRPPRGTLMSKPAPSPPPPGPPKAPLLLFPTAKTVFFLEAVPPSPPWRLV